MCHAHCAEVVHIIPPTNHVAEASPTSLTYTKLTYTAQSCSTTTGRNSQLHNIPTWVVETPGGVKSECTKMTPLPDPKKRSCVWSRGKCETITDQVLALWSARLPAPLGQQVESQAERRTSHPASPADSWREGRVLGGRSCLYDSTDVR